jgi:RNA polymerase sigma-70 factor (ECF subfamily)
MAKIDKKILLFLEADDERALKLIYELYFRRLVGFSIEFVKDREIAKEISNDAIFRFWQNRHRLLENSCIISYLLTIVRNLSLNYLRQLKQETITISFSSIYDTELHLNYEVLADPSWDVLLTRELETITNEAINALPVRCKEVFSLSRNENLYNSEIAEKLNISVKTVEGHITYALKFIRGKLLHYIILIFSIISYFQK